MTDAIDDVLDVRERVTAIGRDRRERELAASQSDRDDSRREA